MLPSQKNRLIESATCTAVFAVVFGLIVSCTGGRSSSPKAWILSHLPPTTALLPQATTLAPRIASLGLLQTSQQAASQIQQSFQGSSCFAFPAGVSNTPFKVNWSGATAGFVPLEVLGDPFIVQPDPTGPNGGLDLSTICAGVFDQVGGGTSVLGPNSGDCMIAAFPCGSGTLTNPGTAIYADGTLSTLIVTGLSVAGKQVRCSDLTDTAVVHDSDLVQPYFVIGTNSVVLAVGTTQLPLTCQLTIDPGDEASSISVQWAKI